MPQRVEVAVVGAGPAGATVARLLAALGRSVALHHAEPRARGPDVESLPPSALPLVEAIGLGDVVRTAAIGPMTGTVVAWAGERTETRFEHPGLQISRARLDPALRFAAVSAGARLCESRVPAKDLLGDADLDCAIVVDATGRRSGEREAFDDWRTLALAGTWVGETIDDDGRTWTESTDRGWVWSVPAGRGRRQVTAMIDPPKEGDPPGLAARHEAEVARASGIASRRGGARLEGLRAVEVTPSIARTIESARGLRVGDAACAVDPLSSYGLKKAFESARLAAVVVHTMLERPSCAQDARATYRDAVETELAGCMAGAAAQIARVGGGAPFFARRTFASPRSRVPLTPPSVPAPAGPLGLAPRVRIESRAVEAGWIFERRPVVVSDRFPLGLRYVAGLDAADVVEAVLAARAPDAYRDAIASLVSWGVLAPITSG